MNDISVGVSVSQLIFFVITSLVGLVINNLRTELKRLETDAKSRSEKNEERINELRKEQVSTAAAITDLKAWLRDQLATLKLELVQGHPTKEDLQAAFSLKNERLRNLESYIRELVDREPEVVAARRNKREKSE